jgi:hypothetical protein
MNIIDHDWSRLGLLLPNIKIRPPKLKRNCKKMESSLVFKETKNPKIYISFRDLNKGFIIL